MSEKIRRVAIDNDNGFYAETLVLTAENQNMLDGGNWSIKKSRLRGGLSDGIDQVEINNGNLSFTVLTTRGMGLYRGSCKGNYLGWHSPAANPVNPAFVNLLAQNGLGWLKGFNECIVRCGLHSNGAPGIDRVKDNSGSFSETQLTLHGHIANSPAKYVELQVIPGDPVELVVIGVIEEAACFCPQYRLTTRMSTFVGSNVIKIRDEVVNFAASPAEFELLYHCNFGRPFLDAGARLVSPSLEVAPRDPRAAEDIATWDIYQAPKAGFAEQGNYHHFAAAQDGSTLSMLCNQAADKGVTIRWNKNQLPCFCQWKHTAEDCEGFVTGMEPATNYPNLKTFEREQGRVINLLPQQPYVIDLALEVQENADQVAAIAAEVAGLLAKRKTLVHPNPIAKWSPV